MDALRRGAGHTGERNDRGHKEKTAEKSPVRRLQGRPRLCASKHAATGATESVSYDSDQYRT
jgi:hypothetical protein